MQQTFIDALRLAGLTIKSVIVWDKKAHGMGDLKGSFAPRYESIIFAVKGRYELPGKRPDDLIVCPAAPRWPQRPRPGANTSGSR